MTKMSVTEPFVI